ncbi:class I adenylate-forming enzyme family protein [Paludibacterium paludis]|uniref:Long-chain acyl-CoA synthetase n=1 Tax=Paludibacterium paludis TaxID=1225769 RepID=A0A918U8X8_9NEIS|nr:AMP-binding protein [Paludibacterium paludis]GGY11300.1 hypothetical protein GCM10011289_12780 [Paludibacterium paludis]
MPSLYQTLRQTEAREPSGTAVVVDGRSLSYRDLLDDVHDVVHFLNDNEVKPGDRLLITDGETYPLVKLEIAASYLGLTLIYLEGLTRGSRWELGSIATDAQADWTVGTGKTGVGVEGRGLRYDGAVQTMRNRPLPGEARLADTILVQCYTSGTTGTPKGVCLSERGLLAQGRQVASAMRLHGAARILLDASIIDMVGQLLMLAGIHAGSALIVDAGAHTEVMSLAERHGATHLMLPPYCLAQALRDPDLARRNLASLELIAYGCAPMDRHLLEQAQSRLDCLWLQGYGLTETTGPFCWLHHEEHDAGKGTVGRPAGGVRLEVRDTRGKPVPAGTIGEVWVDSPGNMAGYWDAASASPRSKGKIEAGWLKTGDAGFMNSQGFLTLKGRLDDVVLLGEGFTVYPKELEDVLCAVPGIIELAVAGADDPQGDGQVPVVFFRTEDNTDDTLAALRARIGEALSPIKHPKYLVPAQQAFTRGKNGKVIKQTLLDTLDEARLIPVFHHDLQGAQP